LEKSYASMLVRGHNLSRLKRRLKKVKHEAPIIAWSDSDDDEEEAFFSE
jgi:hypothetical protein